MDRYKKDALLRHNFCDLESAPSVRTRYFNIPKHRLLSLMVRSEENLTRLGSAFAHDSTTINLRDSRAYHTTVELWTITQNTK